MADHLRSVRVWAVAHGEGLVLAVLLALLAAKKFWFNDNILAFGADGGLYTSIAQNVRDGLGLKTNVAIFHKGFEYFPHPTSVYPLWPLLYGYVAKVLPLTLVGVWLPTLFYFGTLILAYFWGRRVGPKSLLQPELPPFHGGHLLVLMLGVNFHFFTTTSMPYTEGLGFFLLFALLLRVPTLLKRPGPIAGLEWGVWLALLLYARAQFFIVWIAAGLVLVWSILSQKEKRAHTLSLVTASITVVAAFWPYYQFRRTFLPHPGLKHYLRFDLARPNALLSEVPVVKGHDSLFAALGDRLKSISAAFTWSLDGYYGNFSVFTYGLPLALVILGVYGYQKRALWRQWAQALRSAQALPWVFVGLLSLGAMSSLHVMSKVYGATWHFGSRQGLFAILVVFFALLFVLRSTTGWRAIGMFVLIAGAYSSYHRIHVEANEASMQSRKGVGLREYRAEVFKWLEQAPHSGEQLRIGVLRPEAQKFSWRLPKAGVHWLTQTTTLQDLSLLFQRLGVSYVVLPEPFGKVIPAFFQTPQFDTCYEQVARFEGNPERFNNPSAAIVYRRKDVPPTCETSQAVPNAVPTAQNL